MKTNKKLDAQEYKIYSKYFNNTPVRMLDLTAIFADIVNLLTINADLDVEMPKLILKYKQER